MSSSKPSVSVIVPVHRGDENFIRCIRSIAAMDPPAGEIIVAADGGADDIILKAGGFGAHVLELPGPSGPAKARNFGAARARSPLLFFVDADVTVYQDAVGRIQKAFEKDPDLAALFGSYDDDPFENNFLSQYKNLLHHFVHQNSREEACTFWGACGAIRQEVFRAVGGFDTAYKRPAIEDIEMGYRLTASGYKIRLVKDLQVKHYKRWGVLNLLRADFFYRALPWTSLLLNKGSFLNDLNLKTADRISVVAVYVFFLSIVGLFVSIWCLVPAAVMACLLLRVNQNLYSFFRRKRGLVFLLKAIPWHWFYFFYGGLAFVIGFAGFKMGGLRRLIRRGSGNK